MHQIIPIIGPGGSGKSTCGKLFSGKINFDFLDLDEQFNLREININSFISLNGYVNYCMRNLELYVYLISSITRNTVFVLSSGFMCYDDKVHPNYDLIKMKIIKNPNTICVLASTLKEKCIEITVNRQMNRSYLQLNRNTELEKIRRRYDIYKNLGVKIIENSTDINLTVNEMIAKKIDA